MRKPIITMLACIPFAWDVCAAEPTAYYNQAEGLCGRELIEALCGIINTHDQLTYKGVWEAYATTDIDENGKIWDMYSTKRWTYGSEQCGNYTSIGGCYNREHSMPKSWFNDAYPMYTDIFHLYPTDGKVNNQRGNYPFGECENGTYEPSNGSVKALGRLGASTFPGYKGTVFEPDDQYKGDFARSYFYMAACYNTTNSSWQSDMFAGNSYPFFQTWAEDMLLKWHRQDPVSDKELKRNEAVYALQHNRNPFIDHPELAEHIWGDKKDQKWMQNTNQDPAINTPADGSTINIGISAKDIALRQEVNLQTTRAKDIVYLSATSPFTVTPTTIEASEANKGTNVVIEYKSSSLGKHTGTLTITTGETKSTVTLEGETVDGLPAGKATFVTSESFRANWTYVGDDIDGKYELTVIDDAGMLEDYPIMVDARKGYHDVVDLMPQTQYSYTLRSRNMSSQAVTVTTAELKPFVDFLFDGELYFVTKPGEPSEVAEILVQIENIDTEIEISVGSPFELSLDRSSWSERVSIDPDESRVYLRLLSDKAGNYEAILSAKCGDYVSDHTVVSGTVSDRPGFFEDFEASPAPQSSYSNSSYNGSACVWNLYNVGSWPDNDSGHDSAVALRFGKASNNLCAVEMATPKPNGASTISFWAKKWTEKEALSNIAVETSTDNGASWHEVGNVDIADTDWKEYVFTANVAGDVAVRFRRTKGARLYFDDVAVNDYTSGVADPSAEHHQWDAYSIGGTLCVTVDNPDGIELGIYAINGTTVFCGHLGHGRHSFGNITPGQFVLVSSATYTRTVLIR